MICRLNNNAIKLAVYPTKKFKDVTINLRFYFELNVENFVFGDYCSEIITNQCAAYPSKDAFARQLDYLYGASIEASIAKAGKTACLSVTARMINGDFVSENLLQQQLALLEEIVFRPNASTTAFTESLFLEAQDTILANIAREKDNPYSYAYNRALQIFGAGYPLAITTLDLQQMVITAKNEEVYRWYRQLIENAYCEIIAVGNLSEASLSDFVAKFAATPRAEQPTFCYLKEFKNYQEVQETAKIQQSQLVLIYSCPFNFLDKDFFTLMVANALFGQLPTSLLFQEVREKRSLCYSIYSRLLPHEGGLLVSTGINKAQIASTVKLIKKLFNQVKKEEFTEEAVTMAKDGLVNAIQASQDDAGGLISEALKLLHIKSSLSNEQIIAAILAVDKTRIPSIWQQLKLETVYSYQQEAENE